MTINYRKAYLTNGTQVKITEELFQQFKQWEQEGHEIPFEYSDMLKQEDNAMINANRNYYIHNIPLEEKMLRTHIGLSVIQFENMDEIIQRKERNKQIVNTLKFCTETQRRRFIKHYYLDLSFAEIARQEGCYESAIRKSVGKVEKLIISRKSLL